MDKLNKEKDIKIIKYLKRRIGLKFLFLDLGVYNETRRLKSEIIRIKEI